MTFKRSLHLLYLSLCLAGLYLSPIIQAAERNLPPCIVAPPEAGVLQLPCWPEQVRLNGTWLLHHQNLDGQQQYRGSVAVPGLWRQLTPPRSGMGQGQYRLTLEIQQARDDLGLHLPWMSAARQVHITVNGQRQRLLDAGYSKRQSASAPYRHPLFHLPPLSGEVILEIDIFSDFSTNGGMYGEPILGDYQQLLRAQQRQKAQAAAMCAVITLFALVNLLFWSAGRAEYGYLLLGALALVVAMRLSLSDSDFLYDFAPHLSVAMDTYFGWLVFLAGTALGAAYFRNIYPAAIPLWLSSSLIGLSLIGLALLVVGPIPLLQQYGEIYRPLVAILAAALTTLLVRGYLRGQREILYSLVSSSAVLITFIFEILYFHYYAKTSPFLTLGFGWLLFLCVETLQMSSRFRHSLQRAESLSNRNRLLEDIAHRDVLTDLPNRRSFEQRFEREFNQQAPGATQANTLALALIDLDHFKQINDGHGHDMGDAVLQAVAKVLREKVREKDFVARIGGEEFCLLMPGCQQNQAQATAERLRLEIEQLRVGSSQLAVSASIGLACRTAGLPRRELLRRADRALYRAKRNGRNCCVCDWEPNTTQHSDSRVEQP